MAAPPPLLFVPVGTNRARPFGMPARERACRLAASAGLECADAPQPGTAVLLASMDYAWDPAWLEAMRGRPGTMLTLGNEPVMAHVRPGANASAAAAGLEDHQPVDGYELLPAERAELSYAELRKRGRPFVMRLDCENVQRVERAAYDAAYKGVTDILTLFLWRRAAFHLTRWAARARISPNEVTLVGALLCGFAFYLFWIGDYWLGTLSGFVFMVLDTVDGKLARVTGSSSKWGEVFDHGIDLVHPPFWYWAWEHGLTFYGRPIEPVFATMVLLAIVGGYVGQRLIEGLFIKRLRMEIHVWRPIDSHFRLITARRNPNMLLLVGSLLFSRPDVGLELVAGWTLVSLLFHAVRFSDASERASRGERIVSWLGQ